MMPSSMISGDRDRYCPYDPAHVFPAKGFSAHLIRCRENNRHVKKVSCPLDNTHKVPAPELHHHLANECDKRCLFDRELQMKAGGDSFLRGDVKGPPIVSDHFAGQREDQESWDDLPKRSVPTPALFNKRVDPPPGHPPLPGGPSAYVPPGGYNPPPPTGGGSGGRTEPEIRKIPNAPAQAAILSNLGSSTRMRAPGPNQVFNYSMGLMEGGRGGAAGPWGMPRMNANQVRNTTPTSLLAARPQMSGVRAPGAAQGPRLIGRGISKYATKSSNHSAMMPAASLILPASQSDTSSLSPKSEAASSTNTNHTPTTPSQFDNDNVNDAAVPKSSPSASSSSSSLFPQQQHQHQQQPQQQQQQQDELASSNLLSKELQSLLSTMGGGGHNEEFDLKKQQLFLQQGILLQQQQQLEQLKQQHEQHRLALANKHQLQILQLQKLQTEERQRQAVEQDKLEQEVAGRAQQQVAGLASLFNESANDGLLEALMRLNAAGGGGVSGGNSGGGLSAGMGMELLQGSAASSLSPDVAVGQSAINREQAGGETWHEEARDNPGDDSNKQSPTPKKAGKKNKNKKEAGGGKDLGHTVDSLQKSLDQITILDQKSLLGHRLSAEEERMLNSKADLENRLAALKLSKS